MNSWRDTILRNFVPDVNKLTLVADPDSLMTEEMLSLELRQRGFDLIEFTDPVEFRYAYESKYRSIWDRGEYTDLVVILRLEDVELESLPYDLLQAGRQLSFNLGEIFPNLSYPVIEKMDRGFLDALYDAQCKSQPGRMGDNATKDFILRFVFGIAPELISSEVHLLRDLLRLHYGNTQIPDILVDRFVQLLKANGNFDAWPLEEIVSDQDAFFAFLQERWPIFLSRLGKTDCVEDMLPEYGFKYSGPDNLPFSHQDIRVYIDNLFIEGKLTPVQADEVAVENNSWIRSGIASADRVDEELRINRLFDHINNGLPTELFRYSDWITFAQKWAELTSLVHCGNNAEHKTRLNEVGDGLNAIFIKWLFTHYASLINLPPIQPAMLHHVPRRLARDMEITGNNRTALIVVDGLALDQWVTVRQILEKQDNNLVMRESATFAWIPTMTSVSRQSIFAGRPPLYFPASINTTNAEEKLWKQFWEGNGISRLDIAYQRGLGDGDFREVLETIIHPGKTRAVGLVVDKVDKIMHGMQLGAAGMHNQIKQWCKGGFLGSLIGYLIDCGYSVWLTSDHGNIECEGKGRPSEGVIAETRGERARVYPTQELRSHVADQFRFSYEWHCAGLPLDYFALVAGSRDAFVKPGESTVAHGGISIEEVIVPLVKFERSVR